LREDEEKKAVHLRFFNSLYFFYNLGIWILESCCMITLVSGREEMTARGQDDGGFLLDLPL
jgi:hypothetical protein